MSRTRHTDKENARVLRDFEHHDGSAASFCRQRGVSYQTLINWRRHANANLPDPEPKVGFMLALQRDLTLAYRPEHWAEAKLAAWICRNLPDPHTTHASKNAFVSAWLGKLLQHDGYDLARAATAKPPPRWTAHWRIVGGVERGPMPLRDGHGQELG